MVQISDYIVNNTVQRSKIAMDVAYGSISKDEIRKICTNKEIKDAFIGEKYSEKIDPSEWNREYLDEVVCAAVAECFNEDYLLYLSDVGAYVRSKKNSSSNIYTILGRFAVVVAFAIILGVVIWKIHNLGQ